MPVTTQPEPPTPPSPAPAESAEKPPLKWLLGYRVLGLRLPPQYRSWVAKDVTSKRFLTRRIGRSIGWAAFFLLLFYVARAAIYEAPSLKLEFGNSFLRLAFVVLAACLLSSGATLVRNTLRWQRIDRHGRPVRPRPKSLAILDNQHAVVLGVLVAVLFTGASAVYTDKAVVPDGPRGAKCQKPKVATMARIRAGLKDQSTKIENPQEVRWNNSSVVAATVDGAGQARKGVFWIVTPSEIYELALGDQRVTTYETPTASVDRVVGEAIQRIAMCQRDAIRG